MDRTANVGNPKAAATLQGALVDDPEFEDLGDKETELLHFDFSADVDASLYS